VSRKEGEGDALVAAGDMLGFRDRAGARFRLQTSREDRSAVKTVLAVSTAIALVTSSTASGLVLDCEVNIDGTYTCVEVGATAVPPAARAAAQENFRVYLEKAQAQCEYDEPRRRTGGRAASGAQRLEDLKRARKEYDECVATKAEALRQADEAAGQ